MHYQEGLRYPQFCSTFMQVVAGGIWSQIDLVLSRKTGEQQGFSRMCARMNYHCESCDGRLATPCSQLETEKVLRKNFEIQPGLKRES